MHLDSGLGGSESKIFTQMDCSRMPAARHGDRSTSVHPFSRQQGGDSTEVGRWKADRSPAVLAMLNGSRNRVGRPQQFRSSGHLAAEQQLPHPRARHGGTCGDHGRDGGKRQPITDSPGPQLFGIALPFSPETKILSFHEGGAPQATPQHLLVEIFRRKPEKVGRGFQHHYGIKPQA